jgi:hypothetical protein
MPMKRRWLVLGAVLLWLSGVTPIAARQSACCLAPAHVVQKAMPCCPIQPIVGSVRSCCLSLGQGLVQPAASKFLPPMAADVLPGSIRPLGCACDAGMIGMSGGDAPIWGLPPRKDSRPRAPPVFS